MFVIQKPSGKDGIYANASFYVQDLKRDGGKSKAKNYVLWYSAASVMKDYHGVTKFDDVQSAQEIIDHYPRAFGNGCKVVSLDVPVEIARKQDEYRKSLGL